METNLQLGGGEHIKAHYDQRHPKDNRIVLLRAALMRHCIHQQAGEQCKDTPAQRTAQALLAIQMMPIAEYAKAYGIANAHHDGHADPADDQHAKEEPELWHGDGAAHIDHCALGQQFLEILLVAVHLTAGLEHDPVLGAIECHILRLQYALIVRY